MNKVIVLILSLIVGVFDIKGAPIQYNPYQFITIGLLPPAPALTPSPGSNPKFVWNFVGDIITNSGFLPVEINVPDSVSGIANGAQNLVQGIAMVAGNLLQRIPFVTRLTSPEQPRPLKVLVDRNGQVVGMMTN